MVEHLVERRVRIELVLHGGRAYLPCAVREENLRDALGIPNQQEGQDQLANTPTAASTGNISVILCVSGRSKRR